MFYCKVETIFYDLISPNCLNVLMTWCLYRCYMLCMSADRRASHLAKYAAAPLTFQGQIVIAESVQSLSPSPSTSAPHCILSCCGLPDLTPQCTALFHCGNAAVSVSAPVQACALLKVICLVSVCSCFLQLFTVYKLSLTVSQRAT